MTSPPQPLLSPEQYLELDSRADRPSEYYDGVMYPIEATTVRHSQIHFKLIGLLEHALRESRCRTIGSTVRLRLPSKRYAYPDIMVVCGQLQIEDQTYDTVLNPTVIIEVLSPSTGDFDRGGKADMYRAISTLNDYVIVAQDRMQVQRYARLGEDRWSLEQFTHPDSSLHLESIAVEIPLREIYEHVEFARPSD